MTKKKILLFVPSNDGTTIAGLSLNLLNAIKEQTNMDVKVALIYKFKHGKVDFGDCIYFSETNNGNKYFSQIQKVKWFKKIKKEYNPDITINTLFICSIICVLSGGNDKKIGIFHSPHAQAAVKGQLSLFLSFISYVFIYSRLDKLFCVSQEIADSIKRNFKFIKKSKIQIVYNIHNVDYIRKSSEERISEIYKEIFDNNVVLYCGRLDKNKAPERLLNAFILALPNINENAKLVFMGADTDNLWNIMLAKIKEYKLENRVYYIGIQDNPYKFIKSSYVFVSCSYSEGLPGVIIESLILKTPVISTNSSIGIWEIMSVSAKYKVDLNQNYETTYGLITPNNAYKDINLEQSDIIQLSKALESVFLKNYSFEKFEFETQISSAQVVKSFVE